MATNKLKGIKAEYYFMSRLNALGIPYTYLDDWYDFDVLSQKVEVKSCVITRRDTRRNRYGKTLPYNKLSIGRFNFGKDEELKDRQYNENIWVCFILRHKEEFMLLGFTKARTLNKTSYVSLHRLKDLPLFSLNEFIVKYTKEDKE